MQAWARNVARIDFDKDEMVERARRLAARLSTADWVFVRELRLVPYLEGRPVGEPVRDPRVAFCGNEILFEDARPLRCVELLADDVTRQTGSPDLGRALVFSYERPQDVIDRYFRDNFRIRDDMEVGGSGQGIHPPQRSETALAAPIAVSSPESARGQQRVRREENRSRGPVTDRHGLSGGAEQAARRDRTSEHEPLIGRLAEDLELLERSGSYVGSDGRVLRRSESSRGLWELWSPDGRLLGIYWVRRHCLERQPLEVPAEVWERVRETPQATTFVLLDADGRPQLLTGAELLAALEAGRLELFPASYRLRQRR